MMAMIPPLTPYDIQQMYSATQVDIQTHAIKGTALIANYMVDEYSIMQSNIPHDDEVKLELCKILVEEMFKKKMIEFTKEKTVHGGIHYRARIFAVPNTDVQLLRELGTIK